MNSSPYNAWKLVSLSPLPFLALFALRDPIKSSFFSAFIGVICGSAFHFSIAISQGARNLE